MSHKGKIQLIFIFVAPPDQVAEGDRIFRSHGPWMEATHHRTGDKALLSYNMSKAPELSNPVDLNSAPTGNTCFILNEIYETDAGVTRPLSDVPIELAGLPSPPQVDREMQGHGTTGGSDHQLALVNVDRQE